MRRLLPVVCVCIVSIASLASCHIGGEYGGSGPDVSAKDKGEVNGRSFDFVSNKPDGDDWTIRVRGTALFVSYAKDTDTDKLGTIEITDAEGKKFWRLVDKLDMASRKQGSTHHKQGYVTLALREPKKDGSHKTTRVYVSRSNNSDDDVTNLASYLVDLVSKYKHETPAF